MGNTVCGTSQIGHRLQNRTYLQESNGFTCNTYHNIKFVRSSNTVEMYIDDSLKNTINVSWLDNYSDYTLYFHLWGNGTVSVKNIKLKAL